MSSEVLPRWAWITLGAATVGGALGLFVWSARRPAWDVLLSRAGVPRALWNFAAIQRYTESRNNPKAGLGRPELFPNWAEPRNAPRDQQLHEAEAAEQAYDRNAQAYAESPFPRRMWVFGSGGAYGLLPANALAPWKDTDALRRGRVTPYDVFNPWKSTIFFLEYVRRMIDKPSFQRLPAQDRNWLALKRGMASPSLVDDVGESNARSATSRRNATKAAQALGIPEDYLYETVPLDWPRYPGGRELIA
ncbi:hypothetical protein G6O69_21005 [Pseudenhygromyxa sp. WMMC2535]|uniref:hypothetical protein n=1 Tax=Pseudenhygromyxa sp. WMMC2535 TaxID=2712867 RepID=UPI001551C316|nr:hypothetical protein [Pseudenhygromyxa sp. WMMC2535]NVB40333.1 hypothetical protein [Pseudenhygromyxa sp. WMMC2535]